MVESTPRPVPVYVVVPPRVLLLDVAGPMEVLRKANLLQSAVRFDVVFVGPARRVGSSVGMTLADVHPLPARLPDGALVVVPGHADVPLGAPVTMPAQDAAHETAIVDWLRRAIRPGVRVATICSGAMLAARAGLLDGFECTTHHECTDELARVATAGRFAAGHGGGGRALRIRFGPSVAARMGPAAYGSA